MKGLGFASIAEKKEIHAHVKEIIAAGQWNESSATANDQPNTSASTNDTTSFIQSPSHCFLNIIKVVVVI